MEDIYDIINENEAKDIEEASYEVNSLEIDESEFSDFFANFGKREKPMPENKIMVPEELDADGEYTGDIYGYIREDSGYHIILGWDKCPVNDVFDAKKIGSVGVLPSVAENETAVYGKKNENGKIMYYLIDSESSVDENGELTGAEMLRSDIYTLTQKLFSRNSGLIETDWMKDKCAVIAGCGSVGSLVALQLARSGVGRFVLFDTDCVEIHNVCRHQCNLSDIGRYKVDAIEERILLINPNAEIKKYYKLIQDVDCSEYADWLGNKNCVFIGCCDNHSGDAAACDRAYENDSPFVSLLFSTRAAIGEMFMALPERGDICFSCAYHAKLQNEAVNARRNHNYVGVDNEDSVKFFPGLDVDIEYGVSILDKVALDILNRYNPEYEIKVANRFNQMCFFAGTGSKTNMEEFWANALKEPLKLYPAALADDCRRCEKCLENKKD